MSTLESLEPTAWAQKGRARRTMRWNATTSILAITVALFVLSWVIAPGSVSSSAIDSLLPFAGILAIAAIGQTIVVMLKGIDLSLPGMMTVAALVSSQFANEHGSVLVAIAVVAAIAVVVGVVNGVVVAKFMVSPLVATLAMNAVLVGAALAYSGGTPTRAPEQVSDFALAKTVGVSNTVWLAVLLMIAMLVATRRTSWGRRISAVGANERSARAAGIRTDLIKITGYVGAALCYSGAGILLAGYVSTPSVDAGNTYLLPAIAAVVVGGTALSGGRGNIVGTALGALFLSQLTQMVLSLGAPTSTQLLIQASVIVVAVGLQQMNVKELSKRWRTTSSDHPNSVPKISRSE